MRRNTEQRADGCATKSAVTRQRVWPRCTEGPHARRMREHSQCIRPAVRGRIRRWRCGLRGPDGVGPEGPLRRAMRPLRKAGKGGEAGKSGIEGGVGARVGGCGEIRSRWRTAGTGVPRNPQSHASGCGRGVRRGRMRVECESIRNASGPPCGEGFGDGYVVRVGRMASDLKARYDAPCGPSERQARVSRRANRGLKGGVGARVGERRGRGDAAKYGADGGRRERACHEIRSHTPAGVAEVFGGAACASNARAFAMHPARRAGNDSAVGMWFAWAGWRRA